MIEKIIYNDNLHVLVFDEPIPEYYELVLKAASDTHRLSKNYRNDILKENVFMTLWILNDKPACMYGLQKDPDLPSNTARVFNRFYISSDLRSNIAYKTDFENSISGFYSSYQRFHKSYNIDTLFFTRNLVGNKKEIFLERFMKKFNFKKIKTPKVYKNTAQYFFVNGSTDFLKSLPDYQEKLI